MSLKGKNIGNPMMSYAVIIMGHLDNWWCWVCGVTFSGQANEGWSRGHSSGQLLYRKEEKCGALVGEGERENERVCIYVCVDHRNIMY